MNISEIPGVKSGHDVEVQVHAKVGDHHGKGSLPVRYDPASSGWATYKCEGVATSFSCDIALSVPSGPNVRLPYSENSCFVDPTWDASQVTVQKDISYGLAVNPYFGKYNKNEELFLDVYFPPASDTRKKRPVFVYVHGGAFIFGNKTEGELIAPDLARRGYVVASISYRLVPIATDLAALFSADPAVVAAEDARAAVRFLRSKADEWGLDTDRIAVGGASAGALTSNLFGFGKDQPEGFSGTQEYSSHINAVVSVSGSMRDQAFCGIIGGPPDYEPSGCLLDGPDLSDQIQAGDIPVVFIHSPGDKIVTYAGAWEAKKRADAVGVRNLFLTIPGDVHVPVEALLDEKNTYLRQMLTFLTGALNLGAAECPVESVSV